MIKILAIESSCDDTSVAIINEDKKILYHKISTQKIHSQFGGVVPELAAREHLSRITSLVDECFQQTKILKEELSAIAFSNQPGLLGPLFVGANFAKAYSFCLNKPLIVVNHLDAHVMANFLSDVHPDFPFLCLTVSGGHSQIVHVLDEKNFIVLGKTIDDAVGEAFDKIAKILNLSYPGGRQIDILAQQGDPHRFHFPRAKVSDLNYSFSGIKTAFKNFLAREKSNDENFIQNNLKDICASIQNHLVDMLFEKFLRAIEITKVRDIALAGGVAANSGLRERLWRVAEENNLRAFSPEPIYCTDNAAMIAVCALEKFKRSDFVGLDVQVYSTNFFYDD
ncbi:MAG: tRNA (adenosine(37)-N6)-threonylcarbamoyltransferase complex transferase subunit TsaD [Cytophagales bacterium]|nr:tRNA (adenosine(37)-N6)-threonylcarbamoyltransferase complex transferase subunit TsaD [Cytophagales bacterium]